MDFESLMSRYRSKMAGQALKGQTSLPKTILPSSLGATLVQVGQESS